MGTSLALLVLPTFIEQQRMEMEEMQSMQKKQVEYVLCTVLSCEVLIAKAFREERNACARL